jgi:HSP20 family protein
MVYCLKIKDKQSNFINTKSLILMTLVKFKHQPMNGSFNNLMDNFFSPFTSLYRDDVQTSNFKHFVPANVKEVENGYLLELVAPGLNKEDFKIDLDQNILTVSAEVKKEAEQEKVKSIRNEYQFQSFKRSFTVDKTIDTESISAQYVNGVLALNLPKKAEVKPQTKQISVQ